MVRGGKKALSEMKANKDLCRHKKKKLKGFYCHQNHTKKKSVKENPLDGRNVMADGPLDLHK